MINKCIGCYYHDSKENVCTHGSPIFLDDICTDYQDNEFVKQVKADAIDDFVAYANTMPTVEDADGYIRPMTLEEMAEEMKKGKTCADCIIDGTDACPRGAGRAVDDDVCEEFLEGETENE